MKKIKVLVTSGGSLLGQGIIRAALASGLPVEIAVCDPEPLSAGMYWADETYSIPYTREGQRYIQRLQDILEEAKPDVVFIGTDHELPMLAPLREVLENNHQCKVVVSEPEQVRIADDKWATYQWLRDRGIGCPESAIGDDADKLWQRVGFPLVAKPRIGQRSKGFSLIGSVRELDRSLDADRENRLIYQECVGTMDQEYTAGTVHYEGAVASIVMRRILRDGNTYQAFADVFPELNAWIQGVALQFGAYGPANFQFRLDADGKPRIFEINARFSGTTGIRWHAGFNDVELVLRYLIAGHPVRQPGILPTTILRHWSETVIRTDGKEVVICP